MDPTTRATVGFDDATAAAQDPPALRAQLEHEGYAFVRGLLPAPALEAIHDALLQLAADAGWLVAGSDRSEALAEPAASCCDPDPRYEPVRQRMFAVEAVHRLLHLPRVGALLRGVFGDAVLPHPKPNVRAYFPGRSTWAHHDYLPGQGSSREYTVWLPLSACPREMGGLEIAAGSHRLDLPGGVLDHAGLAAVEGRWRGGDFALGDVVIFNARTVHRAPVNLSQRLRLSIDMRFQPRSEPISESALLHEDWPGVYAGWTASACKYYWHRWPIEVVPVDTSGVSAAELEAFHALPPEQRRAFAYERWQRAFAPSDSSR